MFTTNGKMTRNECGGYDYKGYNIYRTTTRRDAYNPWKISLSKHTFPTLAAAKKFIDEKEVARG